jgi:hypothetical protein
VAELYLYEVPHRNFTTTVKLSEEDAEMIYGDEARKIRPCAPGVVPPTPTQPWAETPADEADEADEDADEPAEKKAPATRNKSRSSSAKG